MCIAHQTASPLYVLMMVCTVNVLYLFHISCDSKLCSNYEMVTLCKNNHIDFDKWLLAITILRMIIASVMAGLIGRDAFHAVIMLCNELKVSECKAYWLTDFPLVVSWACAKKQLLDTSTIITLNLRKKFHPFWWRTECVPNYTLGDLQ